MRLPLQLKILLVALAGLCGVLSPGAMAQSPVSNLVVTLGTTAADNGGNNWSYVVIGAADSQLLAGKQFAIYAKAGYPTNVGAYSFRTNIFRQSNTAAINALLNQSLALGENLATLSNSLNRLFAQYNPAISNTTLPQQVLMAFQATATNADISQTLGLLAHTHPGLLLCSGQGFSEVITGVTTYEVYDINPATGLAASVIGRVTVVPGAPTVLPAPGIPFQVTTTDATDDLRIRLRWGTSDAFRRLSLLSFGFNVWRIPASNAVALGFNSTAPTMTQLYSGNFYKANMSPVIATKDFSTNLGVGGANDSADGKTYFFSDKNGYTGITSPATNSLGIVLPLSPPSFKDGDQFYYFITAVDILGRDGMVSPGGLAEACRRIPPAQPSGVAVQNTFHVFNATTRSNQQFLTVTWQQDLNTGDQVGEYWIYRWPNPALSLTNDIALTNNRIGVVSQISNSPTNFYQDNGAGAPMTPGATNYWYTVRAVSQTACGPLLSANSMPAWGVLRQRVGPPPANGRLLGSCGSPAIMFQNFQMNTVGGLPDNYNYNYLLTAQRLDPGTAWVEFFLTNQAGVETTIGPAYFAPGSSALQIPYSTPTVLSTNQITGIACVIGTQYGLTSAPAWTSVTATPGANTQLEAIFTVGQVMLTSLDQGSPLLPAVETGNCLPAVGAKVYPDGTVRMQFNSTGSPPVMLIQAQSSGGGWVSAGVSVADANGFYSVFYPQCLLGPLPNFQGCPLNLADEGDCSQHISAGGPGSPVNRIQITFSTTPGTAEFRLYRSVNNGPLTLIYQGAAKYDSSDTNATIVRNDDAMPPSASELCYYVQLLDENGNAGPLAFLGCKDVKPPTLPTPVLSQPQTAGNNNTPQVTLDWFCPTSGVYRFEIAVERTDHPFGKAPLSFSALNLTLLPGYNLLASFFGLLPNAFDSVQFDAALLTPPVGAGFGPGSKFTLTANVVTNASYNISMAAVDDQGNAGPLSKVWNFTWRPTTNATPVPWPARPLPTVNAFDDITPPSSNIQPRVAAVLLYDGNSVLDPNYPVGIRIGDLSPLGAPVPADNIGTTNFFSYSYQFSAFLLNASPTGDPNSMIFQRLSNNPNRHGNSLLPIVVYRQQVANAAFPKVTGTITQVTPLIEHLAYGSTNSSPNTTLVTVYDRLIAGGSEVSGGNTGEFLYLRDQQPVILGASYQYFVVRMNAQREIAEIIPAGTVTIPSSL
jgi:hypothetical protein